MKRHLSFVAALGIGFFASMTAAYAQVRADTGSIAIRGASLQPLTSRFPRQRHSARQLKS